MKTSLHLLATVPTPTPSEEKKIWLLEWMEPWQGGKGEEFKHRAFEDEKEAIRVGQEMLERRLTQEQEPFHYIARIKRSLEMTNSRGDHYCLGIFITSLKLE